MKLIDADALKEVMCIDCDNKHLCTESPACDTVQQIDAQPTIEPKHGRWIKPRYHKTVCQCSVCGILPVRGEPNYCPNCGAKMNEVSDATAETYEATFGDGSPITYTED